jgi:hypothetical protein
MAVRRQSMSTVDRMLIPVTVALFVSVFGLLAVIAIYQ